MRWALCLLLLAGCGFHPGRGGLADQYGTIYIPYAEGDPDGSLTSALVHELSRYNGMRYDENEPELTLYVRVASFGEKIVGYRFDREKTGKRSDRIVASEERMEAVVEVIVMDNLTNQSVLGPVQLRTHVDYDHDYYTTTSGVGAFSLGQLTDHEVARESALVALHEAIAKDVSQYLEGWK